MTKYFNCFFVSLKLLAALLFYLLYLYVEEQKCEAKH